MHHESDVQGNKEGSNHDLSQAPYCVDWSYNLLVSAQNVKPWSCQDDGDGDYAETDGRIEGKAGLTYLQQFICPEWLVCNSENESKHRNYDGMEYGAGSADENIFILAHDLVPIFVGTKV